MTKRKPKRNPKRRAAVSTSTTIRPVVMFEYPEPVPIGADGQRVRAHFERLGLPTTKGIISVSDGDDSGREWFYLVMRVPDDKMINDCMILVADGRVAGRFHGTDCIMSRTAAEDMHTRPGHTASLPYCRRFSAGGSFLTVDIGGLKI